MNTERVLPRTLALVTVLLLSSFLCLRYVWGGDAPVGTLNVLVTPPQKPAEARTLLIIQGSWRSFSRTVDLTIENLILPNMPCDVVLSLGSQTPIGEAETNDTLSKLSPFLIDVLHPEDDRRKPLPGPATGTAAYAQVIRALDVVNLTRYEFIMRVRTDLAMLHPFSFATVIGRSAEFPVALSSFISAVRAAQRSAQPCDVVAQWLFSLGSFYYLPDAIQALANKRAMIWAPVTTLELSPHLLPAIKAACAANWGGDDLAGWRFLESENSENTRSMIAGIVKSQHLMWVQGGDWMSFGAREDFFNVYNYFYNEYVYCDFDHSHSQHLL